MSYQFSSQRRSTGRPHSYRGVTNNRRPRSRKENIHPSRFVNPSTAINEAPYEAINTFNDFEMDSLLLTNITSKGISTPTPIQDQAIPVGLKGQDVIGLANTGTGKTIAFAVPVLNKLIADRSSKALIMAPTRELASQIEVECRAIAQGSRLRGALLIGGTAMGRQLQDLSQNPSIVIGTPGRIKDHMQRGSLNISNFNLVVLDEVDRMLDMGFINDIRHILSQTAAQKQSFFFSATLDDRVKTVIDEFSNNPVHIVIKTSDASSHVDQNIVSFASKNDKIDKLHDLLIQGPVAKTLVFDDTQRSVERLCKELQARGFETDAIHGGKSQSQRQRALKRFKDNQINVLVATDVAARGIDVIDITHVINYSTPQSYSDYVHRIGRAGRAGRPGYALTFIEQ